MKAIVVGEENLVYFLSKSLMSKGYEVSVINRSEDACHRLSQWLELPVVQGDGTDIATQEDAGARYSDAFVALTPYDQDNYVACKIAKEVFGVPKTLALVHDPMNKDAFEKAGISIALSITSIAAGLLDQSLATQNITHVLPLEQGKIVATRVRIKSDSPSVDRSLQYLNLPSNSVVGVIFRGDDALIPRGNTILKAEDVVLLISTPEAQGKAVRALAGGDA